MNECRTCAHFLPDAHGDAAGSCCRFPPTVVYLGEGPGEGAKSAWPEVHPDDWCGEWKPEPSSEPTRRIADDYLGACPAPVSDQRTSYPETP